MHFSLFSTLKRRICFPVEKHVFSLKILTGYYQFAEDMCNISFFIALNNK